MWSTPVESGEWVKFEVKGVVMVLLEGVLDQNGPNGYDDHWVKMTIFQTGI